MNVNKADASFSASACPPTIHQGDPGTEIAQISESPVALPKSDENAVQAALDVLFKPGDVVELRALAKGSRKRVDSGYFDYEHFPELARHAVRLSDAGFAVYVTLNPVDPQLLSRCANRVEQCARATTGDRQVLRRRWLLVDIDPVRPSGVSATDAQLARAKKMAKAVKKFLAEQGWPEPLVALSGNGFHLLYAVDLPNDEEATSLVKGVLALLADEFDDDHTKVDRSVYNAARICKLYGTVANKGDHTADTPWRKSEMVKTPPRIEVSRDQLGQLQPLPATTPVRRQTSELASALAGYSQFNLEDFLARHDVAYTQDEHDGRERFKLAHCPFNPEHVNGEAAIFRDPSGMLGFKCMHDSCDGKGWRDVRAKLEGSVNSLTAVTADTSTAAVFSGPPINVGAGDHATWPDPQSLIVNSKAQEYPVNALPETVRSAVLEVGGFVKAPVSLIASSALAALSLAQQAQCDVERATKLSGPTGLYLLAIADSGERKSTCDVFFTKAIRDYEAQAQAAAKPLIAKYKSERDAWNAKRKGVEEKIKALARAGQPTHAKEQELMTLDKFAPVAPVVPRLIYGDATPEALTYALAKTYPSAGVISSEAGSVFGSHGMGKESAMRNFAALNQLWDGATLPVERRSSESFTVRGARVTISLQAQEPTIREFFANTHGLARGTGFLARFLMSWPDSTQGTRDFTEPPTNWPALAAFNTRLTAILQQPIVTDFDGGLTPLMLKLSPAAKAAWVAFHNDVESKLGRGGELSDVKDVASKAADNAARLAALFHVFCGGIGPIGLESMKSAVTVAGWHLDEARRFLGELALPADIANAQRMDTWLRDYCNRHAVDRVQTRTLQQFGPAGLRDAPSLAGAIRELTDLGRVRLVQDGRKRLVQINPALLYSSVATVAGVAVATDQDEESAQFAADDQLNAIPATELPSATGFSHTKFQFADLATATVATHRSVWSSLSH